MLRRLAVPVALATAALLTVSAAPADAEVERGCGSRVESGDFRHDWLPKRWTRFGPIALTTRTYAHSPPAAFSHVPGRPRRYYGQKLLVLVSAGKVAKLGVPSRERGNVALLYERRKWKRLYAVGFGIREGETAVTFRACRADHPSWLAGGGTVGTWTEFNGGILVKGSRCVDLDVRRNGRKAARARLPFGAPCRPG